MNNIIFKNERGFIEESESQNGIRVMVRSVRNFDGMIAHDYNEIIIDYECGLCQTWGVAGYHASYIDWLKNREAAIAYGKQLLNREEK